MTDSKTTVFNKVFYSTVQNHIGELILTVSKFIEDEEFESKLWDSVSEIIHNILNSLTDINTSAFQKLNKLCLIETLIINA